jgi:two-component system LytT family sensor kinase
MKINDLILPFKSVWQFIIGTIFLSSLMNLFFWPDAYDSLRNFAIGTFWSGTIWATQWIGNVYIGTQVEYKYSWLEEPLKRTFVGLIAIMSFSTIAFIIVQSLMHIIFLGGIPTDFWNWTLTQLKGIIFISPVIAFAFAGIGFFKNWRTAELNAQKLETEMLRYKYESLQNQINPHFLFNSFNVLTDLIQEDDKLAVQFVQKMSGLYRYVLESKEKELVPLNEELAFIKQYIFLLETRFDNKVVFHLNIEASDDLFVVPMAIQLLIENAIKHNIASSKKVLTIDLKRDSENLRVTNNLQLKTSLEPSSKKGLENLRQQYKFFTMKEIEITQNESIFKVSIPLLEKK